MLTQKRLPDRTTIKQILRLGKKGVLPKQISEKLKTDPQITKMILERQKARRLYRGGQTINQIKYDIQSNQARVQKYVIGLKRKEQGPKQTASQLPQNTKGNIIALLRHRNPTYIVAIKTGQLNSVIQEVRTQKIIELAKQGKTPEQIFEFFNRTITKKWIQFILKTSGKQIGPKTQKKQKRPKKTMPKAVSQDLTHRLKIIDEQITTIIERKNKMEINAQIGMPEYKKIKDLLERLREEREKIRRQLEGQ